MESEIKRFNERYPLEDEIRCQAEKLFIRELLQDKRLDLKRRIKELKREFPDIANEVGIIDIYYSGICGWQWKEIAPDRAKAYCKKLMSDIPRYLYPDKGVDWLISRLHDEVMFAGLGNAPNIRIGKLQKPIAPLKLDISLVMNVYPQTRKSDIEKRIIPIVKHCIKEKWKEIEEAPQHRQRLRYIAPKQLKRDVKWLYLRIFHGYTGDTMPIIRECGKRDYTPEGINKMIRRTAKILSIRLPRGRIPGAEKRQLKP